MDVACPWTCVMVSWLLAEVTGIGDLWQTSFKPLWVSFLYFSSRLFSTAHTEYWVRMGAPTLNRNHLTAGLHFSWFEVPHVPKAAGPPRGVLKTALLWRCEAWIGLPRRWGAEETREALMVYTHIHRSFPGWRIGWICNMDEYRMDVFSTCMYMLHVVHSSLMIQSKSNDYDGSM